jgi:hypothetical protein
MVAQMAEHLVPHLGNWLAEKMVVQMAGHLVGSWDMLMVDWWVKKLDLRSAD